jgi:hypothetical protein
MTGKAESTEDAVAQRSIGLELEFPIPVDKLKLSANDEALLKKEPWDGGPRSKERQKLQYKANIRKDESVFENKSLGFEAVVDHGKRVDALRKETPAGVETPEKVKSVLENIYAKVEEISKDTNDLTKRTSLKGSNPPGYYVGPINTEGIKPEELSTRAYSLQVNIGVETGSIAKFIGGFAGAPELQGEGEIQIYFRRCLTEARKTAQIMVQRARKQWVQESDLEEEEKRVPLSGLEGLFAIIALYLIAGKERPAAGEAFKGGTVKNFTPLLLKTPISGLAKSTLNKTEKELWVNNHQQYLTDLLSMVRGKEAVFAPGPTAWRPLEQQLLVWSERGLSEAVEEGAPRKGPRVEDLISGKLGEAPFVKTAIPVSPTQQKAVFETRYQRLTGDFGEKEAYQRAMEVFNIEKEAKEASFVWD